MVIKKLIVDIKNFKIFSLYLSNQLYLYITYIGFQLRNHIFNKNDDNYLVNTFSILALY